MIFSLLASVALLGGCFLEGDDGSTGPAGPAGADGQDVDPATVDNLQGQIDDLNAALEAASQVEPESCSACHGDVGEEEHQSIYDDYTDASALAMTIEDVSSTALGTVPETYDVSMTVSITKNGLAFIDADGLPSLEQKRFYLQGYDSACTDGICYPNALNVSLGNPVSNGDGTYTVTASAIDFDPATASGQAYAYIAQGLLDTEPAGHVSLYEDVASAGDTVGDADTYVSAANVEGCQKCHGTPYRKHGYREAVVENLPTFSSCKVCHMDDRAGGHEAWQQMVDDPVAWANGESAKLPQYAYTRKLMNDVHMSHAMEFPYPMSMANCATCHEGKMDMVTSDDLFVAATCKSCHPVQSTPVEYVQANRAPALEDIWAAEGVGFHDIDDDCQICHTATSGYTGDAFSEIHTGYNPIIYADTAGTKYSDEISLAISNASIDGTDITFDVDATGSAGGLNAADMEVEVLIGLYGYDTKNYIVNGHDRYDSNGNGVISRSDGDLPKGAYIIGTEHAYFTNVSVAPGDWTVTAHLAEWADMIANGTIKHVEIGALPILENGDGEEVALNAVSRTLDLDTSAFDDTYFHGVNEVIDVDGCNACHDALGTTFHSPDRGGSIQICKMCHVTLSGGSHLEMQSRGIDSYIHAIHSFQAFDSGDIDFTDAVEAARYELHIEHTFPNFTIKNCEACHNEGTFNVPDQSESLPGKLSGSDTWNVERNIGDVPAYVAGPASRACGGCHRADLINEDAAGELAAWNQHTKTFGYLVEDGNGVLDAVIEKIMGMF